MAFVFSWWYIVAIVLVLGIVASLVVYFYMDKQDKVLINNFVASANEEQPAQPEEKVETKVEEKSEEKVEEKTEIKD